MAYLVRLATWTILRRYRRTSLQIWTVSLAKILRWPESTDCISSTSLSPTYQKVTRTAWRSCSQANSPWLRLLALEVHDLVVAKLVRNSPIDLEDAKFLAKTGKLDETVLRQRYEQELRPYLANESRHDLTLNLWLDACFHS